MALIATTISAAIVVTDNSIVLASAASVAPGRILRIDEEWFQVAQGYVSGTTIPVLRGRDGSACVAHNVTTPVVHGNAADFSVPPAGAPNAVTLPAGRPRRVKAYIASGAIQLPLAGEDMVALIGGTSALTMTVAAPPLDLDGALLWIFSSAKNASTIQFAGTVGIGNAAGSYDIITLQNAGNVGLCVMAVNGFWNVASAPAITGTTTAIGVAIA